MIIVSFNLHTFLTAKTFVVRAANTANAVTVYLIFLRVLSTFISRDEIWKIFAELREIFSLHGKQNAKYKIKSYLDSHNRLIKTYAFTTIFVFVVLIFPVVLFLINGKMFLVVNYWYPFDPYTPQTFAMALFWNCYTAGAGLSVTLGSDSLLYGLISVIAMEFDILATDMMSLGQFAKHERKVKIQSFTDRHNNLIKLCEKLQNIYEISFLNSFVVCSFAMCFVAFQITTVGDMSLYTFYIPLLGFIGGQILLLCYFGQKIIDASENICDGIYNCGWEDFGDVAFKKQLILMIARSQKTKRLTAMNFSDISLESFASVSKQKCFLTPTLTFLFKRSDCDNNSVIFYIGSKRLFC
jgi:odorant receptor